MVYTNNTSWVASIYVTCVGAIRLFLIWISDEVRLCNRVLWWWDIPQAWKEGCIHKIIYVYIYLYIHTYIWLYIIYFRCIHMCIYSFSMLLRVYISILYGLPVSWTYIEKFGSFYIALIPLHFSLSGWNLSHQMPLLCLYLLLISGPMCLAKVCWSSIGCYSEEEVLLISWYTTEENDTPLSTRVNYQYSLWGRGLGSETSSPIHAEMSKANIALLFGPVF